MCYYLFYRYNNRTYSVEDIDWSLNPSKTFESKNGPITYIQYYKQQYDITIRDPKQPLLLCKSKEREIKGGASVNKNVYLVPELCSLTGKFNFILNLYWIDHERGLKQFFSSDLNTN